MKHKTKIIVWVILMGLSVSFKGYTQSDLISIKLKKVLGTGSLKNYFSEVTPSETLNVKGIPFKILKNYTINRVIELKSLNLKIPTLLGIDSMDRRLVIIDKNINYDFSDDRIIYYSMSDSIFFDTINYSAEKQINIKYSPIKPNYLEINYPEKADNLFFLMIGLNQHYSGQLNEDNLVLINTSNGIDFRPCSLFINPDSGSSGSKRETAYSLGDTMKIGSNYYQYYSLSKFADTLILKKSSIANKFYGYQEENYAYNIDSKDINEEQVELKYLMGKFVILDFWGTWCMPCKEITPKLKELYSKYHTQGLEIISIAYENGVDTAVKNYIVNNDIKWINLYENQKNKENSIIERYRINSFPTLILINPEGKIILRIEGKNKFHQLENKLSGCF